MGGLADRTAAEEARFFRAEDELALRRRMEKFVSTNATAMALENSATSAGPNEFQRECLAASKRSMAKQTNVVSVKTHNPLKVDIDVEKLAGQAKLAHNTFVDYLKVPRVSCTPTLTRESEGAQKQKSRPSAKHLCTPV